MLQSDVQIITTPRLHRNPSSNMKQRFIRFIEDTDFSKVILTGAGLVAVLSCVVLLMAHQNSKLTSLEDKLSASKMEWKRRASQIENRVKRDTINFLQTKEFQGHEVSKRSAPVETEPRLIEMETPQPIPVGGVVYTRWGRNDCPELGPSTLIYHGVTAGSSYSHTGGGAGFLCMHSNVTYDDRHINGFNGASHIYGVEWRDGTWINNLYDLDDVMDRNVQYHSVPCAVCLAEKRYGKVMIPGKAECPEHWIPEYDGLIMASGHSDKHSTEYICMDRRPQVIAGTQGSQGGASIMMVETQCASLQCEPVVAGREIRCVVCTI